MSSSLAAGTPPLPGACGPPRRLTHDAPGERSAAQSPVSAPGKAVSSRWVLPPLPCGLGHCGDTRDHQCLVCNLLGSLGTNKASSEMAVGQIEFIIILFETYLLNHAHGQEARNIYGAEHLPSGAQNPTGSIPNTGVNPNF